MRATRTCYITASRLLRLHGLQALAGLPVSHTQPAVATRSSDKDPRLASGHAHTRSADVLGRMDPWRTGTLGRIHVSCEQICDSIESALTLENQDGVPTQQIWVRSLDTSHRDRIRPYYPRFNEVWHPDLPEPVDGAHDPVTRAIYLHARLVLTPVLAATRPRDDRTSAPETRAVWIPAVYLKPAQHAATPARHTVFQLTLADNTAAVADVRLARSAAQFKASALWGRARTLLDAPYALDAPNQSAAAIATLDDLYPLPRRLSHARLPVYRPPPARAALIARAH
ncbi:hypothetical protein PHLGIDRAFT_341784 [Phlebiopsis gigantea 11061_1 CR5-6]|uniref:Uncharacterized protein n=1 Tax=Phlebiopsis gigantea (strain 11061_1 CR5-6) TaxID=745531 RepID=A0A0C3PA44_PHLG1|nr:hypothetical protein PHLGIDRAFT_341784 [Phlebiopsis gigantea 11061_1 CR5-6]